MRHEILFLRDIIESATAIGSFIADIEQNSFVGNDLVRSAVLQKLIVIGEAAAHLPKKFREVHKEVEWTDIVAFRNIAVHAYFSVDWDIVWVTATRDVPELQIQIAEIFDRVCEGA